jgi:hypothetical protein
VLDIGCSCVATTLAAAAHVGSTGSATGSHLIDLVRRPSEEVHGSKPLWATAIVLINSVGVVPIAYFANGRQRA